MIFFNYPKSIYKLYQNEILKKIKQILNKGIYSRSEELIKFEKNFSKYINVKYSVGVGNATDSIFLALKSLNVGLNDEVITVSHTATGTAIGIANTGARPVFIDINESDFNIDTKLITKAISKKTKAIVVVHLYGQSCDMDKLIKIAKKHKLYVIEDCSQSAGGKYKNKKLGSIGDIGCFSFFPTKNLSAIGDGGILSTNNKKIYNTVKALREYGWDENRNAKYIGINSRLDELQAGILNVKLKYLDKDNKERNSIANLYLKKIKNDKIILNKKNKFSTHAYHLFVVRCKQRNKLMDYLKTNKIIAGIHYKLPVHKQKVFFEPKFSLPVTERISKEVTSLPIYPGLKKIDINKIIDLINKF